MAAVPRVVVTGVGLITPLGVGVNATWRRLLAGNSGVVSLQREEEFRRLPCQLAARVPRATDDHDVAEGHLRESDHVTSSDRRTMSLSTLYALIASDEALKMARVSTNIVALKMGALHNHHDINFELYYLSMKLRVIFLTCR